MIEGCSWLVDVVEGPSEEPLTLAEAQLVAGVDWAEGDPREPLMLGWIAAARSKVEQDTSLPLLTQTLDLYVTGAAPPVITLVRPPGRLQAVTSVHYTGSSGLPLPVDPALYRVDLARGQIMLLSGGAWPGPALTIRFVGGWASPEVLRAAAPLLVHAVGLLIAHDATLGRDLAVLASGTLATIPYGYADAIASYQPVVLA